MTGAQIAALAPSGGRATSQLPTGGVAETHNPFTLTTNKVAPTGTTLLTGIFLAAGQVCSAIAYSSVVAGAAMTHQQFGLYDSSTLNLLASSADDGATAWPADTVKTLNMTVPFTVITSGLYYVAMLYVGASLTLTANNAVNVSTYSVTPLWGGISGAGLTALAATAGALSVQASIPYALIK